MIPHVITNWDDAYANVPNIPGGEAYPERWLKQAAEYRKAMSAAGRMQEDVRYGPAERDTMDIFMPQGTARGLFVFIHGGYWMRFDKSFWSHLAAGALAHGHGVVMPSYSLCPAVHIRDITREIGLAVTAAAERFSGPIVLSGHSAGGHLAARMISHTTPLAPGVRDRITTMLSISGVHDLRPLLRIALNETLRLDGAEAAEESPALLEPAGAARVICWVGAGERAEFVRQNALLANVWRGLAAPTICVEEPDRHHFNVIDGLADPESPITRAMLD